jgi:hypothetical protein
MKRFLFFLHPLLFSIGSAIIIYVGEPGARIFISPNNVLTPVLFTMVVCLLFILLAYAATRQEQVAGVIASLSILGIFYVRQIFFLVIGASLFGIFVVRIVRRRVSFVDVNLILGAVSTFVFGYYIFNFASFISAQPWSSYTQTINPIVFSESALIPQDYRPDIYYIILDGYGRADMLQTVHGYDDAGFIRELEEMGFIIPPGSQANYPRTLLSLASSLNMQYLDEMATTMGNSNLWWPVGNAIGGSQVRLFLEKQGYQTVFFASGWDFTNIRTGSRYLSPYPIMLDDFERAFIQMTNLQPLAGLDGMGISFPSYQTHRNLILYNFTTLQEVASDPGPKFVFSHIVAPHPPFVFDADGGPLDPDYPYSMSYAQDLFGSITQYRQSYLEQLTFINKMTVEMIAGILARSKTPPIIILQADHGPGIFMDYNDSQKSCLYERFSILNAFYLPGVDERTIPSDISPVNSFRMVLNAYFKTGLTILPNKEFFSTNVNFYQFEDVTGRTETPCDIPPENQP